MLQSRISTKNQLVYKVNAFTHDAIMVHHHGRQLSLSAMCAACAMHSGPKIEKMCEKLQILTTEKKIIIF